MTVSSIMSWDHSLWAGETITVEKNDLTATTCGLHALGVLVCCGVVSWAVFTMSSSSLQLVTGTCVSDATILSIVGSAVSGALVAVLIYGMPSELILSASPPLASTISQKWAIFQSACLCSAIETMVVWFGIGWAVPALSLWAEDLMALTVGHSTVPSISGWNSVCWAGSTFTIIGHELVVMASDSPARSQISSW